jgi:hypothetical protein
VVGADEGDGAALDHRDRVPAHPSVLPNQEDRGRGVWGEGEGMPTRGQGRGRKEIKGLGVSVRDALGIGGWIDVGRMCARLRDREA